jgi:hypothetical protein
MIRQNPKPGQRSLVVVLAAATFGFSVASSRAAPPDAQVVPPNAAAADSVAAILTEALAAARGVPDADRKVSAICDVANAQAAIGLAELARSTFAEAFAIAHAVPDEYQRESAVVTIATAQVRAGFATDALVTAKDIENDFYRATVLCYIAEAQAKAGQAEPARQNLDKATTAACQIEDATAKAAVLGRIVLVPTLDSWTTCSLPLAEAKTRRSK